MQPTTAEETLYEQWSATSFWTVRITGTGLTYDSENRITGGTINEVSLEVTRMQTADAFYIEFQEFEDDPVTTTFDLGDGVSATRMAELFGRADWNDADQFFGKLGMLANRFDVAGTPFEELKGRLAFVVPNSSEGPLLEGQFNRPNVFWDYGDSDNTMIGGRKTDLMDGGSGDDLLRGRGGDDRLLGGDGDDILRGGAGDDILLGWYGHDDHDILRGGTGNDYIHMVGNDRAHGGAGADMFLFDKTIRDESVDAPVRMVIRDFNVAEDVLSLWNDTAEMGQDQFMDHAQQRGDDVVYRFDGLQLILRDVTLGNLTQANFVDDTYRDAYAL